MRIFHLFVLYWLLGCSSSANILHLVEEDPQVIALISLMKSGISTEDADFQTYQPNDSEGREKALLLSNSGRVQFTFLFKPGEANFPIIINGPLANSEQLMAPQVQFSKKIIEQFVEFFGSEKVLLPGYIPYAETSHMSSPFLVMQIPADMDLESFANEFKKFLILTFPQLKEELHSEKGIVTASNEPPVKSDLEALNWLEEEPAKPFYGSQKAPHEENLNQFRKRAAPQQKDPFEVNTDSGSWNLANPLMSFFSSRESPPRTEATLEESTSVNAREDDSLDPFAAYFSQESLHLTPPSEGKKTKVTRPEGLNSSDEESTPVASVSTPRFSASLVQSFPQSVPNSFKASGEESGALASLILTDQGDLIRNSSAIMTGMGSSTSTTNTSRSSSASSSASLDLELLYFMQAPWDREPSESPQSISTTPEPIPEYLKQ